MNDTYDISKSKYKEKVTYGNVRLNHTNHSSITLFMIEKKD